MKRFCICRVEPPGYPHSLALLEVAELLAASLASLGARCETRVNQLDPRAVNIILGYHLLSRLEAPRVIVYQLEQLSAHEGWLTPEREAVLRSAWAVWDYSPENVAFLRARGFQRLCCVPLGYHPALERIRHLPEAEKDIDVLFYGSDNERRRAVIGALRRRLKTQWLFGVYGADRDAYISRAKIILNVHFYQARILEQVRLAYLLNNRCFVVSEEPGGDFCPHGVAWGSLEQLPELCERYASQPDERRRLAEQGYRAFSRRPMVEHVRAALREAEAW